MPQQVSISDDSAAPSQSPPRVITLPRQTTNLRHGGGDTKLTPQLAAQILSLIRRGAYRAVAARSVGVAPETLSRWMHRQGEPYETFARHVLQQEAGVEVRLGAIVIEAAKTDPRLALAFLGRRYPERWAKVRAAMAAGAAPVLDLAAMLGRIKANRRPDPRGPRPVEARPVAGTDSPTIPLCN